MSADSEPPSTKTNIAWEETDVEMEVEEGQNLNTEDVTLVFSGVGIRLDMEIDTELQ